MSLILVLLPNPKVVTVVNGVVTSVLGSMLFNSVNTTTLVVNI